MRLFGVDGKLQIATRTMACHLIQCFSGNKSTHVNWNGDCFKWHFIFHQWQCICGTMQLWHQRLREKLRWHATTLHIFGAMHPTAANWLIVVNNSFFSRNENETLKQSTMKSCNSHCNKLAECIPNSKCMQNSPVCCNEREVNEKNPGKYHQMQHKKVLKTKGKRIKHKWKSRKVAANEDVRHKSHCVKCNLYFAWRNARGGAVVWTHRLTNNNDIYIKISKQNAIIIISLQAMHPCKPGALWKWKMCSVCRK